MNIWKGEKMNELNFIYKCNPALNTECKKTSCQKCCFMTSHKEYSIDGKKYFYTPQGYVEWKGEKDGFCG